VCERVRRYPLGGRAVEQIGDVVAHEELDAAVVGEIGNAHSRDLFDTHHDRPIRTDVGNLSRVVSVR